MNENNRSSLGTYLLTLFSLVIVIALLAAAGMYHFEFGHNDTVQNFGDALWWAIVTMTTIGYGDISPKTVGGRLVAVIVMFIGIGILGVSTAAIAAYFVRNDQFQMLRLRRLRNHVIICGLGEKGYLLTRAFRERGMNVVVIEENESNILVESCQGIGAIILYGDATEPEMLRKANLKTARYLIAVCGEDGKNAEIAAHAQSLIADRKGDALTCSAHIVDPELWYLLRRWEISNVGAFRMQFFNVFDLGARAMLAAHPPFAHDTEKPHILIVGGGKLGQNIALQAARMWRDHRSNEEKCHITLIDQDVSQIRETLHLRRPGLDHYCKIETIGMEVPSPQYQQGAYLFDDKGKMTVTSIYICLDNDGKGLSAGLALLHRVRHHPVPIVLQMTQDAGLGMLLQTTQVSGHGFEKLHPIGLLAHICQPDLVLGGANEALARALHSRYLRDQAAAGHNAKENPSLVQWEHLRDDLKESNRRQADHIGLKLQSIGCDIAPLTDGDASGFLFSDEEVEKMAKMEHERWVEERLSQGWKVGPRNPAAKTNPNIVPWEQLPDSGKDYNRNAIRELPESLAHAGFQIYRLK